MLREWLLQVDPVQLRKFVYLAQAAFGAVLIGVFIYMRNSP